MHAIHRLSFVLLLLSVSTSASAQSEASLAEAKRFFDAGLAFSRDHRFVEALAAFNEANRLSPRASTQRNIAQTHRDLNDMASAYAAYEELLRAHGESMKPSEKQEIARALEELAIVTGVVNVNVVEPDSMISIDGKERGPSPRTVRLNVGSHHIHVAKSGFEPVEATFIVRGNDTHKVDTPLVPTVTTSHVDIVAEPTYPTAVVFVDDSEVGASPWSGELPFGLHRAFAKSADGKSREAIFEVARYLTQRIRLPIIRSFGTLTVAVDVLDADIQVDGVSVGKGTFQGPVALGSHTLLVTRSSYAPHQRHFEAQEGVTVSESVVLRRDNDDPASATPQSRETAWTGLYGRFDLVGLFPTSQQNNVRDGTLYGPTSQRDVGKMLGGGADLRLGYSFGWFGVEGIARATYDMAEVSVTDPTLPTRSSTSGRIDDWEFHRFGATFAAGGRFMAETVLRPTLGLGLGLSTKSISFRREVRDLASTNVSDATFYVTPTLLLDAGIEVGSRAGARCFLGVMAHVDFPLDQTLRSASLAQSYYHPLPTAGSVVKAATGPEVFVGPVLGLRFGH